MKHIYSVHTKLIEGREHFFVKKIMTIPELGEKANVVVGYGMHTDFDKACGIAGVEDSEERKKLRSQLEQAAKPKEEAAPVKKPIIEITDSVNKWLAEVGVAVLN